MPAKVIFNESFPANNGIDDNDHDHDDAIVVEAFGLVRSRCAQHEVWIIDKKKNECATEPEDHLNASQIGSSLFASHTWHRAPAARIYLEWNTSSTLYFFSFLILHVAPASESFAREE